MKKTILNTKQSAAGINGFFLTLFANCLHKLLVCINIQDGQNFSKPEDLCYCQATLPIRFGKY